LRWSSESGRRRRCYELTPDGSAALHTTRAGWEEFSAAVTALLGGGRGRPAIG